MMVKCPVCGAVLRAKRGKPVPRHATTRRYSRKTRCSGSGRDVTAKR